MPEFTWNKIRQLNRNSLLEVGIGVDGLKTGHTDESGYGEVVSAPNDGRRLIAVLHGLKIDARARRGSPQAHHLGHARLRAAAGLSGRARWSPTPMSMAATKPSVGLVGKGKIDLFVPKGADNCPSATVTYKGPLRPPVQQGQEIAKLNVFCADKLVQQTPLYADRDRRGGRPHPPLDRCRQASAAGLAALMLERTAATARLHHLRRR